MFPCFYDGVPIFVVVGVVHVFDALCHFLCASTQSNKVNATKLKRAQKSSELMFFSSEQDHEP
jgi:hypothetical protein